VEQELLTLPELAAASDKVYQLLVHGRWFSPGTPASSTTKTGRHYIAEILLKVALKHQKSKIKIIRSEFRAVMTINYVRFVFTRGRGNKKWTILGNWQHMMHKTNKKQNKTPYVLDTTIRKQTQIT
jgi:ABC-type antimicrobial peptide transport system permease subunit